MPEEVKKEDPKKKGLLGKIKEAADDKEEQLAICLLLLGLASLFGVAEYSRSLILNYPLHWESPSRN